MTDDQYVQNFSYWALLRYPSGAEATYWNDIFRKAYANGQNSLLLAARELGKTLFESSEYVARGRDNHWYVYDLYKTYLMRDPDPGGWAFWESVVPGSGRENVRRAFEDCLELANLMATLTTSGSPSSAVSSQLTAATDPENQPGSGLLGRPAEWSVPLISLPGRAGLDLGLTLSYSSMTWMRSGPYIYFDEDNGFPSPGFRLGFPKLQRRLFDARVGKNAYLLITPMGQRVELRQIGSSGTYEAGDSSYLQLIEGGNLLVRSTDGTQLSYGEFNNEYRCTQIKDRNGNYITVNYDGWGHITNITDTLGRLITFNYDGNANLLSITQTWNGQTHTWATFGWSSHTIQSNFSGSSVVGAPNGTVIPVVTQVGLNDGSYFTFQYTNAAQVSVIRRYTSDNVQRTYTATDYDSPSNDCPRLLATRVWAENWAGINGVPAEVTTQYSLPGDGAHQMTLPDGTVHKEFYGTGWQKGLTIQTEVWSSAVRKKWTTTNWTQDDTSVNYKLNPRVTETNVYDAEGNRRRTVTEYGPYAQFGLPYLVRDYAADGVTEIRHSYTDYNLSQPYLDRRLIGLVSAVHVSNVTQWQTKITFSYDDPVRLEALPAAATSHDQSFSTSFTTRGNVTAVSRWDVTDISNPAKALTSRTGYNVTGSATLSIDAAGHQSSTFYSDSFSDSINRNTFAYPTGATDADGHGSFVQYNFDFGSKTRAQGPTPASQSQGVIQMFSYDAAGRPQQVTTTNNGAYTRYVYGPNYVQTFGTVNNATDEAYAIQIFDGLGRVHAIAGNHPGSQGGFKAQLTYRDIMGRVISQSNPAEIWSNWTPAGDDAAGWLYSYQTYDWQSRPLITTNTDGTTKEMSYGGCGCAGSSVVTMTDEGTVDSGVPKRREQRIDADSLGRPIKTEVLNWQGGSVYSTTVNTYNARDQITLIRVYQGAEGSGTFQDTTMTYDNYGRLQSKHVPEQNSGTATTWEYNADDTIYRVTDARGATSTFTYNGRHLVTGIAYAAGSGTTPNVSLDYDAAGNKTSMIDGLGLVSYGYDQLSRLTSETRYFSELNRSYDLSYGYNLANQLTSVSTPFTSQQVGYGYDTAGRLNAVTANGYYDTTYYGFWPNWYPVTTHVTTLASNIAYRASGAVKQMTYGNGGLLTMGYNSRLVPTSFQISNMAAQQTFTATYSYYNDGRVRSATSLWYNIFDRLYTYDHGGRYKDALTGDEARGGTTADGPYRQSYSYDVWGNTVSQTTRLWTGNTTTVNTSYNNNRRSGWTYDANGLATAHENGTTWFNHEYDAAGRRNHFVPLIDWIGGQPAVEMFYSFDGNSLPIKSVDIRRTQDWETGQITTTTTSGYYLHSTALGGQIVADLDQQGNKIAAHIYANGMLLATEGFSSFPSAHTMIHWQHMDPVTGSTFVSNIQAGFWGGGERDPLGADVTNPPPEPEVFEEPPYLNAKMEQFWPIEIEGGRTGELEIGMAQYLDTMDMVMAREAWRRGERDRAQRIIAANPNVGIEVRISGFGLDGVRSGILWGSQAADFLVGLGNLLDSGFLIEAISPGEQRFAHARITQNPLQKFASKEKLSDEACDQKLSSIFGGFAKAMVTSDLKAPSGRGASGHSAAARNDLSATYYDRYDKKWKRRADRGGIIHVYTDSTGSQTTETRLFTPAGWNGKPIPYYVGGNSGLIFNYAGGITIEFVHVGTTNVNNIPTAPQNIANPDGLVDIGYVGGEGGEGEGYYHTHIVFFSNKAKNERIDPRVLFCGFKK